MSDQVKYTNDNIGNDYINLGCQREGHMNQKFSSIFISEKTNQKYDGDRFGCPECVCERYDERTLSYIKAMNVLKDETLFNFPKLDQKVREDVVAQINIANLISYDTQIESFLNNLQTTMKEILERTKEEAFKLTQEIKESGDKMKEVYRNITNCDKIKNCVTQYSDWQDLNTQMDSIISGLYANKQNNDKAIKDATDAYIKKLQSFQQKYLKELKDKILNAIDSILFEKTNKVEQNIVPGPSHQTNPEQYLKTFKNNNSYKQIAIEFNNSPIANQPKLYKDMKIETSNQQTIISFDQNEKKFCNQVVSTALDSNLTYKITVEVLCNDKSKSFQIGLGDFNQRQTNLYEKTPYQKLFFPQIDYKSGCNFVEYGTDLAKSNDSSPIVFVFKFNINKNQIKFRDVDKTSSNCLSTNAVLDKTKTYCVYIINQSPSIFFKILSVETK